MDEIRIIRFNDDTHAERVFVEGKYVGTSDNIGEIIKNSIDIIKQLNDDYKIKETSVWVCDDFDEENEGLIDDIWDYFNEVQNMTENEIELIQNKEWTKLAMFLESEA